MPRRPFDFRAPPRFPVHRPFLTHFIFPFQDLPRNSSVRAGTAYFFDTVWPTSFSTGTCRAPCCPIEDDSYFLGPRSIWPQSLGLPIRLLQCLLFSPFLRAMVKAVSKTFSAFLRIYNDSFAYHAPGNSFVDFIALVSGHPLDRRP